MSSRNRPEEDGSQTRRKRRIVPPPASKEQPNIYKYGLRTPRRTGSEGEADAPSAADEDLNDKEVKHNGTNTNVTRVNVEPEQPAAPVTHQTRVSVQAVPRNRTSVAWSVVLAPLWYPVWITWLCCYTVFSVLTYWDTVLLVHLNQFYRYTLGTRDRARDYHPTQLGRTLLTALLAAALLWTLLSRPGSASINQGPAQDLREIEALSEELEQVKSSTRDLLARLESLPSAARVQLLEEHVRSLDKSVEQLSKHAPVLKHSGGSGEGASEELLRDMSVSISTLQTSLANTAHSLEDKVTILTERLAGLSLSFDALSERVQQQSETLRSQLLADEQLHRLIDQRVKLQLDAVPRPDPVPALTADHVHALVERELATFMNDKVQTLVDATLRDLRGEIQQQVQTESRATVLRESELRSALIDHVTQLIGERTTRVEHTSSGEGTDRAWIQEQIRRALHRHIEGDVTARTDYALLTADAHIYKPLTHYAPLPAPESRAGSWAWLTSVFGSATRVRTPHGPRVAIHRSGPRSVGECWGFGGARANLTVKLSQPISVSHVTIDHLSRDIAYNIESAPREFQIWSVNVTQSDPAHSPRTLLGTFEYDIAGEPVQTFALPPSTTPTQYITLEVQSNHGHYYTCLYRFRVHGTPLHRTSTVN